MRTLFALAAIAASTAFLSMPASATTIGCDPAEPTTTVKAIDCRLWDNDAMAAVVVQPAPRAYGAVAAPRHVRHRDLPSVRDSQEISGGASD